MDIPVYLFTGFLESGKTTFIQGTLEDKRFNKGERTLLLVCEEGECEYDPSRFSGKNVFIETVENEEDLTEELLESFYKKHKMTRVLVEYNGMWMISTLMDNMPESWLIYQEMMFADATTFVSYNANMRQLAVDKMQGCEIVIFNRFTPLIDKMTLHKIVRGISRRADIAYEYSPDKVEYDDIEDPMPFDVNAPVIEVEDRDYALFYRDLLENPKTYDEKRVKFKGLVAVDKKLGNDTFIIGRHVMTCCVQDIEYKPILCIAKGNHGLKSHDWITVTAQIHFEKNKHYSGVGPVLYMDSFEEATEPADAVATFY